jgi:Ca2+-binding EF-hand superfamily protein
MESSVPEGMSTADVQLFKEAFPLFDKDCDSAIGPTELKAVMDQMGFDCTEEEVAGT